FRKAFRREYADADCFAFLDPTGLVYGYYHLCALHHPLQHIAPRRDLYDPDYRDDGYLLPGLGRNKSGFLFAATTDGYYCCRIASCWDYGCTLFACGNWSYRGSAHSWKIG